MRFLGQWLPPGTGLPQPDVPAIFLRTAASRSGYESGERTYRCRTICSQKLLHGATLKKTTLIRNVLKTARKCYNLIGEEE